MFDLLQPCDVTNLTSIFKIEVSEHRQIFGQLISEKIGRNSTKDITTTNQITAENKFNRNLYKISEL